LCELTVSNYLSGQENDDSTYDSTTELTDYIIQEVTVVVRLEQCMHLELSCLQNFIHLELL